MSRAATSVVTCAVALAAAGCSSSGQSTTASGTQSSRVSLLGKWTGHRERIASTEGYRNGTATLTVSRQTGQTFQGAMEWSTPQGTRRDPLVGAFSPGGVVIAGGDGEGVYSFRLVDPTTLDYCYVESGRGYRTTCARLKREK